jgi:hypothetical protein
VIVFVIAMAIGMLAYDLWPVRTAETPAPSLAGTTAADG